MNHYNATVHNGALVSTRRGLHVTKTKHQGTRFVNTFAVPTSSPSTLKKNRPQASASDTHHEHKFKFVEKRTGRSIKTSRARSGTPRSRNTTPSQNATRKGATLLGNNPEGAAVARAIDYDPVELLSPTPDLRAPRTWVDGLSESELPNLSAKLEEEYFENLPGTSYTFGEFLNSSPSHESMQPSNVDGHLSSVAVGTDLVDVATGGCGPGYYDDKGWPVVTGRGQGTVMADMNTQADAAITAVSRLTPIISYLVE